VVSLTGAITRQRNTKGSIMSNTKPVARVTIWPVSAAIWQNHSSKGGDPFYSVTVQRTYKDENGKLQNTESFNAGDLLTLAKVADLAHSQIIKLRAADRAAKGAAEALGEDDSIPLDPAA
jgi:hypothetical protein